MTAAMIDAGEYLTFVEREYLAGYVGVGGATVKILSVGDDAERVRLSRGMAGIGERFEHAAVDAATTRVHLVDQVFAAIARQLDWVGLAERVVRSALERAAFPASDEHERIDLALIARQHDVDAAELYRSVRRAME